MVKKTSIKKDSSQKSRTQKKSEGQKGKKMSIDSQFSKTSDIEKLEVEEEIGSFQENEKSIEVEENSQINNNDNKKSRISQSIKDIEAINNLEKNTGVIYIGHLPWGFEEHGIKKYFSQFGNITRIMIPRSQKSGRIKGFGFVEFDDMEVAEIAAKTMNNYILFDRILKCSVVTDTSRYNLLFKKSKNKFEYYNRYNHYIFEKNKPKSKTELKDNVQNLLEKENKKREKIAELGLDYDFPGYRALLRIENKKAEKNKLSKQESENAIKSVKSDDKHSLMKNNEMAENVHSKSNNKQTIDNKKPSIEKAENHNNKNVKKKK